MTRSRYPRLFSTTVLGPLRLKNRAVMSGHHMGLGDGRGGIGPRLHAYMLARASGGAAMVGLESSPVHPSSIKGVRPHLFLDSLVPELRALADDVHKADSRLSVILWHGGHNVTHLGAGAAWAPSAVPGAVYNETPKAMTAADIRALIAAYAAAARRCREAGLDALEVQTSSDYLLGSFLNPVFNRRTDAYGGSPEKRLRIIAEVLEAVRQAAGPSIAVGVRTSVSHQIPGAPLAYASEDSLAAMESLAGQGLIDYVSLITGSHYTLAELMPPMTKPRAGLMAEAARFRAALPVPVMVAGRIRTAAEAESVLAAGAADVIALARPWIADADWLRKTLVDHEVEVRPCISCNQACTFAQRSLGPATCAVNPEAGRELELTPPELIPGARRKTVAVVGGGPAGLEAARVAALRGHRVALYEAEGELGGAMRLAAQAPHREEIALILDWWQRELERLGVPIYFNHHVNDPGALGADAVIWAVGAQPAHTAVWRRRPHLTDGIPGAEALLHGRSVLQGQASVQGTVFIIDEEGSWPAISFAEQMAATRGVKSVTMLSAGNPVAPDLVATTEAAEAMVRLRNTQVILFDGVVARVDGDSVETTDGRWFGPYDCIVLMTGTAPPSDSPADAISVGDCIAPRGFWAAVNDAARVAREI